MVPRTDANLCVTTHQWILDAGKQMLAVAGILRETATIIEAGARDYVCGATGGIHCDFGVTDAASKHVIVSQASVQIGISRTGCLTSDIQNNGVIPTSGAAAVLRHKAGQAPAHIKQQLGVVAGHSAFQGDEIQRGGIHILHKRAGLALGHGIESVEGDGIGAKAAHHHFVPIDHVRTCTGTQFDDVVAARGGTRAAHRTQGFALRAIFLCEVAKTHFTAVPQHDSETTTRRNAITTDPADDDIVTRGGGDGVAAAQRGQQAGRRDALAGRALLAAVVQRAVNARTPKQFTVISQDRDAGQRPRNPDAVTAHAARYNDFAHVSGDGARCADLQQVVATGGRNLIQRQQFGQTGRLMARIKELGKTQTGIVTRSDTEGGLIGIDSQRVTATATDEGHVAIANRDHVGTATREGDTLDAAQRAVVVENPPRVTEHDAAVVLLVRRCLRAGPQGVGIETNGIGAEATDHDLVTRATANAVAAAAIGDRAFDGPHEVALGSALETPVVAQNYGFTPTAGSHRDGVRTHAAQHDLVPQIFCGTRNPQGNRVRTAGGRDLIRGFNLGQAAQNVEGELGVVTDNKPPGATANFRRGGYLHGSHAHRLRPGSGHGGNTGDTREEATGVPCDPSGLRRGGGADIDDIGTLAAADQRIPFT